MNTSEFEPSQVNAYLAHKQHLLPGSQLHDLVEVTRDIVALHATAATGPYVSLWARVRDFERAALDAALYDRRELARVLCMRTTLHVVLSSELPFFFQACAGYLAPVTRQQAQTLLVQAGLCPEGEADALLEELHGRVLDVVRDRGAGTVREITQRVPTLRTRVRHDVGKPYEGAFSLGSRLVPGMCALALLIRARPRGTWRSNLYDYAALEDWLPRVDLNSAAAEDARAWLARRYLAAFGPATVEDLQWWTGLSRVETEGALRVLGFELREVKVEGLGNDYLMLASDSGRLAGFAAPEVPYAFLLPGLDPYVMGYRDRSRFLAPEHRAKVLDRAGNAMPTVWVDGRVVGAWGQRSDGSVTYGLFEPVPGAAEALVAAEVRRLEGFLGGEALGQRSGTPFTQALA
jgi:hypothetical protein